MSKSPRCPRDPAGLAEIVVDTATGEVEDREWPPEDEGKDHAAVALGAALRPAGTTTKLLFVCSQNRPRSPTAERVFSGRGGLQVASAGVSPDANTVVTPEMIEWADIIFVMKKTHQNRLRKRFKANLGKARIVCLNIPDEYEFMDPMLVRLLSTLVPRYLTPISN